MNADAILIMGSNMAENHPIGFQWVMEAKERGAKIIHVDPRFSRTSAVSDIWAPIRAGSDIVFLGGLVNYVLENGKEFREYVVNGPFDIKRLLEQEPRISRRSRSVLYCRRLDCAIRMDRSRTSIFPRSASASPNPASWRESNSISLIMKPESPEIDCHSWALASTLCFQNHGPITVHEFVPTATYYAFGSHPHRVFSIRYVVTGFFHCDSTVSIPAYRLSRYSNEPAETSCGAFCGTPQKSERQ